MAIRDNLLSVSEWKKLEIGYTFTKKSTTETVIGTYPELINAKEYIVCVGVYQDLLFNFGSNVRSWRYQEIATDYEIEYFITINVETGVVSGRQTVKGSASANQTIDAIYYR